jgi:hypothetical protein
MTFLVIILLGLAASATMLSAAAVAITRWTLGRPRTSALVAFGYSQLLLTGLACAIQQKYDGTHLLGTVLGTLALYWAFVQVDMARYDTHSYDNQ